MAGNAVNNLTQLAPAAKHAIVIGSGTAQAGGLWAWFGSNHQEIGAMCACIGAACALYGVIRSEYTGARRERNRDN